MPRKYLQLVGGLGVRVVGLFYAGKNVTCPICNHSYSKFLPYGRIHPRENALCPHCLSLERHRLIWMYLKDKTNFFSSNLRVLHIAPEACFIKRFEKIHRDRYITADIESPLAKVKMDVHAIPFDENTFDVVLCNHVLEHVRDDLKAMSEIKRVLKPQGFAILQVPFFSPVPAVTFEDNTMSDPREREKVFGQADHVRKYGNDYAQRIESVGLRAIEDHYASNLADEIIKRSGLPKEEIYRAEKLF